MKLKNQVCSPEQGKKLKELGIEQFKSLASYCVFCPDPTGESYFHEIVLRDVPTPIDGEHICDVFTVAELSAMLPFGNFCIPIFEGEISPESDVMYSVHLETWISPNRFRTVLVDTEFRKKYMDSGIDYTMAESLASMLITMLEKGIVEASFCNEQLSIN